jgi:predicted Co/Zn/Cd cation transporter (cation efflux family)
LAEVAEQIRELALSVALVDENTSGWGKATLDAWHEIIHRYRAAGQDSGDPTACPGAEALERRTGRIAGALLLGLAVYIVVDAGRRLLGFGAEARESLLGIVLTAISAVVMPLLGWAKLRTAAALRSGALRADAYETIACSWLSLTTLAGLILNASLGWWWADPLAALVVVPLVVREGLEG